MTNGLHPAATKELSGPEMTLSIERLRDGSPSQAWSTVALRTTPTFGFCSQAFSDQLFLYPTLTTVVAG